MTKKQKIDWNLKFFRDVFGIENLHFGFWQQGQDISVENLKLSQQKYTEVLISKIPKNVKTILDVGCGTGEIAKILAKHNYEVECISPDIYQYEIFIQKNPNLKFYLGKFEEVKFDKKYDLVLMAESCQYIKLDKMFSQLNNILLPDGYLLVADYFRKKNTKYYKTTHLIEDFYNYATKYGFVVIAEEDITENVLPTLSLAKQLYNKYVIPVIEILSGYFTDKFPILAKIVKVLFFFLLKRVRFYIYYHTKEKLDEQKFKIYLTYRIILLRKK
ncbi:MAG: class I SAM-dependent methyltransferase [Endomicrobia bacterium]|nr:class I SAM-dependent methyltransferase [Endomicrobiia bacterium]